MVFLKIIDKMEIINMTLDYLTLDISSCVALKSFNILVYA